MFLIYKTKSKVSLKLEPQEQNIFSQRNWEPPQKRKRKVFLHLRLAEILKTNGTGHMTSDRGPLFPGVNGSALPPPPSESCGGTSQRARVSRVQSLLRLEGPQATPVVTDSAGTEPEHLHFLKPLRKS